MHCLYGGYNLHRFSDVLGLVYISFPNDILTGTKKLLIGS